jgi:hypothetical protein
MGRRVPNAVLDAALDEVINNADRVTLCSGEPADYAAATTLSGSGGNMLADVAVGTGDFTKADGDVSGRKATVAAQSGVTIDESGTVDHYAIVDDTNSAMKYITVTGSTSVTAGQSRDVQAWDIEIEDPTAP